MMIKIRCWKDIEGLENEDFIVVLGENGCTGRIKPKHDSVDEKFSWGYLSTHTFYPSHIEKTRAMFKERGFEVDIVDDTHPEFKHNKR